MKLFELNGGSFIGTASAQSMVGRTSILANATTTVTLTFTPVRFNGQSVGTGNAVLLTFTLANPPLIDGTLELYVDGILKTITTDYSVVNSTGVITFVVAPDSGAVITANYYGAVTKAMPMIAGQAITVGGVCSAVTSTASITIS